MRYNNIVPEEGSNVVVVTTMDQIEYDVVFPSRASGKIVVCDQIEAVSKPRVLKGRPSRQESEVPHSMLSIKLLLTK